MFSHRALRVFQPLYRQQSRSISSSTSHRAEEPSTPRRTKRKERLTLISNEVAALQRGPPAQASSSQPPTTSAGFLETPPSTEARGRMGQNTAPSREGINAQGIARPDNITEPSEGGVDVLSAAAPGRGHIAVRPRAKGLRAAGRAYVPKGFSKQELLSGGHGTATIAGRNFEGVVEDRIRHALSPGARPGEILSEERVGQAAEQGRTVRIYRGRGDAGSSVLKEEVRNKVVEKLVRGHVGGTDLLRRGKKLHPINTIRKELLKNGTYLASDARKLVEKVRGFLTKEQWKVVKSAA